MTTEQYDQVKAFAIRLAGEIEWADFPTMPLIQRGRWMQLWGRFFNDPNFQLLLRRQLGQATAILDGAYDRAADVADACAAAMALVVRCLRDLLRRLFPAVEQIDQYPVRVKFTTVALAYTEGNKILAGRVN